MLISGAPISGAPISGTGRRTYEYVAQGGLVFSGTCDVTVNGATTYGYLPAGGYEFAGVADADYVLTTGVVHTYVPADGGLLFGGHAGLRIRLHYIPVAGGLVFAGAADADWQTQHRHVYRPDGGLVFGGRADYFLFPSYVPAIEGASSEPDTPKRPELVVPRAARPALPRAPRRTALRTDQSVPPLVPRVASSRPERPRKAIQAHLEHRAQQFDYVARGGFAQFGGGAEAYYIERDWRDDFLTDGSAEALVSFLGSYL